MTGVLFQVSPDGMTFVSTDAHKLVKLARTDVKTAKAAQFIVPKKTLSNFIGKAKILGTPMGEIVKTFIDEGVKVGVSTRGLGSVKPTKEGIMEVQDDFHLATVDIVTDPSGPNCFVNGIMENTEYYYDIASGNWKVAEQLAETVKELKQEYKQTVRKIDEAKAYRIFESFISSLK